MLPLRELQQRVVGELFGELGVHDATELAAQIVGNGVLPSARLDVYRNNLRVGFQNALRLTYPVIEKLVGSEYFAQLAREYQDLHPSVSGDLHDAGEPFPAYLAERFRGTEYAYFADVATLEWAIEDGRRAAAQSAITVESLRARQGDAAAVGALRWHGAARLVRCRACAVPIWQAHQVDEPDLTPIRISDTMALVLVRATATSPGVLEVTDEDRALVEALERGLPLSDAFDMALESQPTLDAVGALQRLVASNALRD
jgi:Putative DNA-binding domain